MSLILDALRKSEAERRQGQAPDVLAPMAHSRIAPASQAARGHWLAWLLVLLTTAVGAVVAWHRWMPNAPVATEPGAPPASVVPPAPHPAPVIQETATPAPRADEGTLRKPPARTPAPAVPVADTSTPMHANVKHALPASNPTREAVLPDAKPFAEVATSDVERRPPSLAEIDPGRRTNLPPLKLSMHVWADDPAHRFAIIDGHRVMEGAELSGILVREIRRDGVVLSIDGSDYWLPR